MHMLVGLILHCSIVTTQYYKNHRLYQLQNLQQGHMPVQDYIAIFEDLTRRSDVREHHSQTITRFVWGFKGPK